MATYNWLILIHIFGAILMFTGIGLTLAAMIAMLYSPKVEQLREWAKLATKADGLIPLSVLLILAPGLYLTFTHWGWNHAWLNLSLIALVIMTAMGPIINLRRLKDIEKTVKGEKDGPASALLYWKVRDKVLWTSVLTMTLLTIAIVFLMVIKPLLLGSVIAFAVAVVFGPIFSTLLLKRGYTTSQEQSKQNAI